MVEAFLSDGIVAFHPVEREDLSMLADWRNDPRIRSVTREFRPLNMENQEAWFAAISGDDTRNFMFLVSKMYPSRHDLAEDRDRKNPVYTPVGLVGLCHWSPRDRTAEVSFYIAPEWQGKQYARRALTLLHQWGFNELNLWRIFAEAYSDNARSTKLMEGLGYIQEGRLREHVFRNGKRVDSIMLGLLASEWAEQPDE